MSLMYLSTVTDESLPDDLSPVSLRDHRNRNIGVKGIFKTSEEFPTVWNKLGLREGDGIS